MSRPAPAALLDARGVEARADGRAVGPISLTLAAGEFGAVVGAAGAGKRLLLRALARQAALHSGELLFEGRDLARLAPHDVVRMGISLVPRGGRVFQRLTVAENLELGAFTRRETRLGGEYEHVFELFPVLGKRRRRLAATLSRGERLMLAVGRALMSHPRLLLLDEPSAGLPPVVVEKLFEVLRLVNAEGTAVLAAEQAAGVALRAASQAWVLDAGCLVASGPSAQLLARADLRRDYFSLV